MILSEYIGDEIYTEKNWNNDDSFLASKDLSSQGQITEVVSESHSLNQVSIKNDAKISKDKSTEVSNSIMGSNRAKVSLDDSKMRYFINMAGKIQQSIIYKSIG